MAKRDIIYDTKAGRISLGIVAVLLLVSGLVLLVLSIGAGREYEGFWWTLFLGLTSVIFGICNLNILKKRKRQAAGETSPDGVPETEPASLPGEPDELIVVNPTRVNEPDGAILLYRKAGVLVHDGRQIPVARIIDASVTNANSNPYLPPAYNIRLTLDDKSIVLIPAGLDGEWAQEALKQLEAACSADQ